MAAIGVTKTTHSDQRIVVYGAGSAGLGIARQLRGAMVEMDGISQEDANARFWLIDRYGLITEALEEEGKVRKGLKEFARADFEVAGEVGLLDVMKKVWPTVLIGCSTKGGAFTEEIVRSMAEGCGRPIILPLSNPSRLVEVDSEDANE